MVSAIGSSLTSGFAPATGPSTAGIEAQLVRYKKELSDCVNCASAKTPEGKADIEAITNKISLAEARIEKISTSILSEQKETSGTTEANQDPAKAYADASSAVNSNRNESDTLFNFAGSEYTSPAIGNRVDVFA